MNSAVCVAARVIRFAGVAVLTATDDLAGVTGSEKIRLKLVVPIFCPLTRVGGVLSDTTVKVALELTTLPAALLTTTE